MRNEAGSDDRRLQKRRYGFANRQLRGYRRMHARRFVDEERTQTILSCFQHGVAAGPAALIQGTANRVQGARGGASPGTDRAMPSAVEREVRPMGERRCGRSKTVDGLSSGRI